MKWYHVFYLAGILVVATIAFVIGRKKDILKTIGIEMEVIDAKAEIKKLENKAGRDEAIKHVHEKYRKEIDALDAEKKTLSDSFDDDPQRLVEFALRVARK
jgi:ribosomal protein L12E/L44/L45/RPP1/RPP2